MNARTPIGRTRHCRENGQAAKVILSNRTVVHFGYIPRHLKANETGTEGQYALAIATRPRLCADLVNIRPDNRLDIIVTPVRGLPASNKAAKSLKHETRRKGCCS